MTPFLPLSALVLGLCAAPGAAQEASPHHVWSDSDGDGLPDLYVQARERDDVLLRNLGDGGFADATEELGLAGLRSTAALCSDFDRTDARTCCWSRPRASCGSSARSRAASSPRPWGRIFRTRPTPSGSTTTATAGPT